MQTIAVYKNAAKSIMTGLGSAKTG